MNNKNLEVANIFWGEELTSYEIANILSFKKNNFTLIILLVLACCLIDFSRFKKRKFDLNI